MRFTLRVPYRDAIQYVGFIEDVASRYSSGVLETLLPLLAAI